MTHHVDLGEQDGRLRRNTQLERRAAERLPYVHHREPNPLALRRPQPLIERIHALFRSVVASEPDRPSPFQVADHDSVGVPLAYRDLVDPDHLWRRLLRPLQLRVHVLRIEVLDRHALAALSHGEGEALGVKRVGRRLIQLLLLHLAVTRAVEGANLQRQVDPRVPAGQIACSAYLPVVSTSLDVAAGRFPPRWRRTTRAFGSPKMPGTVGF